jgi:hypothetical protein
MQKPSIVQAVHYVSLGSAGGEYRSECRAAVVTEVDEDGSTVGLFVMNPNGTFHNQHVPYHDGKGAPGKPGCDQPHGSGPFRYCPCGWSEDACKPGSWHWPERVEG